MNHLYFVMFLYNLIFVLYALMPILNDLIELKLIKRNVLMLCENLVRLSHHNHHLGYNILLKILRFFLYHVYLYCLLNLMPQHPKKELELLNAHWWKNLLNIYHEFYLNLLNNLNAFLNRILILFLPFLALDLFVQFFLRVFLLSIM